MVGRVPTPAPSLHYGPHPDQVANLHLPRGEGPFPVVVLIHGGFWRDGWDRTLMTGLAASIAAAGVAAWNVEFRRVGQEGGGWPGTFLDVAAAIDHLAGIDTVDVARVVACGHSAGGHLALWAAARGRLPSGAPGARPAVLPCAAVAQAPVADLRAAFAADLGRGAVADLLGGGPDDAGERYAAADPVALAPAGVPQLLVHGTRDEIVPLAQSESYVRVAGAEVELLTVEADHFDVVDPAHAAWHAVLERLPGLLRAGS